MEFFKLEVGFLTQHKYAWFEPDNNAKYSDDFPKCPVCGRATGPRRLLPPYGVVIKQPKNIGDFVRGTGGFSLLVSERFKSAYEREGMTGIKKFTPINITKMGTRSKTQYTNPELFGIEVSRSNTRVDYDKMNVKWGNPPDKDYCRFCGPGGGGKGGWVQSYSGVVVEDKTWSGEDMFFAINFAGSILLSARGAEFITRNGFTNSIVIPCLEDAFDYFSEHV